MSTDLEPSGEITADDLTAALAEAMTHHGFSDLAERPETSDANSSGWSDDDGSPAEPPAVESPVTEPPAVESPATDFPVDGATMPEPEVPGYIEIAGRQWQARDLEQLVGLAEYFSTITPEQAAAIDAIVTGQAAPAPAVAPSVSSPAVPDSRSVPDDDEDFIDPVAAERIRALEAEIAGVRQSQTAIERERLQADQAEHVRIQNAELDTLMGVHGLEPDDRQRIIEAAGRSGMIPNLARQYSDPAQVYRVAFTEALWLDPTLRSKMIQRQVQDAVTRTRNDESRQLAGSVAGSSSGSISRVAPTSRPSADAPIGERINALAESLKPFIEGS